MIRLHGLQQVKPSLNADHIVKMYSRKLIEHAREEMEGVSRALRIELSTVDRTI
jgi:hypothetical protein